MKIRTILASVAAAAAVAAGVVATAPNVNAGGPGCFGTWTIVIGGLSVDWANGLNTGQDSRYLMGHQRVGYNTLDPNGGVREFDRLVREHRAACPTDYIKALGHSEGAAIVHAWAGRNPGFPDMSLILTGDPKRQGGPGRGPNGISDLGSFLGWPLGGSDSNFGGLPTLEVCHVRDVVCGNNSNWSGYFSGDHGRYDFNAFNYPNGATGMVWIG